jgi:hypothetical protein
MGRAGEALPSIATSADIARTKSLCLLSPMTEFIMGSGDLKQDRSLATSGGLKRDKALDCDRFFKRTDCA